MFVIEGSESLWCCRCGERKPAEDFAWRRKARGQRDTYCRPCRSAGSALPYCNWASVLAEIEKCVVVCANCHRRRTSRRMGSVRSVLTALLEAGDETRTRALTLEGSRATATPRPLEHPDDRAA